jgi:hypothetical protein
MKDGTTHMAYKAEQAVDLDTGVIVAITTHGGATGDSESVQETLPAREITCSHRARTTSWADFVLTLFPRAMLIMAAAFKHGFHKEY